MRAAYDSLAYHFLCSSVRIQIQRLYSSFSRTLIPIHPRNFQPTRSNINSWNASLESIFCWNSWRNKASCSLVSGFFGAMKNIRLAMQNSCQTSSTLTLWSANGERRSLSVSISSSLRTMSGFLSLSIVNTKESHCRAQPSHQRPPSWPW